MKDVGGEPCLFQDACQHNASAHRSAWVRFEDDDIPERQGRRDRPDREKQRHIERSDHTDNTDGDLPGERQARLGRGQHLSARQAGKGCRLPKLLGQPVHPSPVPRYPRLPDRPVLDLDVVLLEHVGGPAKNRSALLIRRRRPLLLRCAGSSDGTVDIGHGGRSDLAEGATGGRLHRGIGLSDTLDPPAREDPPRPDCRLEQCHERLPRPVEPTVDRAHRRHKSDRQRMTRSTRRG